MTLLLSGYVALWAVQTASAGDKKDPPAKLELFSKEDWYKEQKGEEKDWVGVLGKVKGKDDVVGFGRNNPYHLTMSKDQKPPVRDVYVGGKNNILDAYVGKKVKLVGKAVEFEKLEGRDYFEIWPARLELIGDAKEGKEKGADAGKELKVVARSAWPWATANPNARQEPIRLVLRSAADLVAATPFKDRDAQPKVVEKQATDELAKALKVDAIDWDKQMVVVASTGTLGSGGIRIDIVSVKPADGKLVVTWKTNNPDFATNAFTHPSQVILVDKAEGKADFQQSEADRPKIRPRDPRRPGLKKSPTDPFLDAQESAVQAGGEKSEVKIIARFNGRAAGNTSVVIKSAEELAKLSGAKDADAASADLAKKLKVDKIDWAKQMVVVVSGGTQRTGGYSVDVKGLEVKDKTLTVQWKLNSPAPGSIVTQALTHPGATVLIDRFDGTVTFDPAPPKGKGLERE